MPELVFAELDRDLARTEPDPEIHALIHDSAGLNLALDFLPGAVTYDPLVHTLDAELWCRGSCGSTATSPTSTARPATPTC